MVKLGEVAEFLNGVAFKPSDWSGEGTPIIRIQNLTNPNAPVNRTNRAVDPKYLVRPGDLLVSWSATLGVFRWGGAGTGLLNQHIFKVTPREDIESSYLEHMLAGALKDMRQYMHGATMHHVNRGEFLSVQIPLPEVEEQRRIAAILDQADAVRAKRREVLDQLDALKRSLFKEMFGNFSPKSCWPEVALGDLAEIQLGKMLDRKKQTGESARPYLRNANVQWFKVDVSDLLRMDFSANDRVRFALNPGDVLVCEGGQPGRCAVWHGQVRDCYYQKALHRVRVGERLKPDFYAWAMYELTECGRLADYQSTATIAHLTAEKLRKLPIPCPPIELQEQFVRRLNSIDVAVAAANRSLDEADSLFASLQSKAFSGQL